MKQNDMTTVTQNVIFVPLDKTFDNRDQAGVLDQEKVLEIAESLKHNRDNGVKGLHQVPMARLTENGYEMAFGRHRRAAFLLLAESDSFWNEIPLIVREMDDLGMFEALADENFKRRDINFVEAAEIIRAYVTKYGKTSVEAAQFFGKTEEYVRSTVRFVSLPETAKDAARRGEMNVTTARLVLSAQKVLDKDQLETVIAEIVKNADDSRYDSPQECIQSALERNAIQFSSGLNPWWNEQKFPVKHLAPVQRKEVADLLDVENQDKARKAMLEEVMTLIASGMEITDAQFPAFTHERLEEVRTLVNPPVCTNCAIFAQIDSSRYCGMKYCFDRKALAWKRAEIAKISKATGVPLYANEAEEGAYVALSQYSADDKKLFAAKHTDLRLVPTKGNETIWGNFPGLPGNLKLVAVGKTAEKRLKKQAENSGGGKASSVDDRKRAEEAARLQNATRELKEEFLARFTYRVIAPAFLPLFEGLTSLPFGVYFFREVLDEMGWVNMPQGVDDFDEQISKIEKMKKKSDDLKELHHLFAFRMLDWRIKDFSGRFFQTKKPLVEMAKVAQEIAAEWGVKLPKNFMAQAETYQADFEKEVKALRKGEAE